MPEFDSAGVRLAYEVHGAADAPAVVLVHGFCSDYHLNWVGSRWQETLVAAGRRVLGLDCRGHGRSQKPHRPADYDRAVMAGDVVRLLDHLGVDRADYLGYSMGGRIGLEAVSGHPGRLRRVILGGIGRWAAAGRSDHSELTARRLRGDASVTDPMARMFYEFAASRPAVNDLEALACCILGPQREIGEPELAAIANPVLVVTGADDPMARGGEALAGRLGHGSHASLPGRNHTTSVPARPFKEAAIAFLSAEGDSGA